MVMKSMAKALLIAIATCSLLLGEGGQAANTGPAVQTGTVSGKVYKPGNAACADAQVELVMSESSKLSTKTDANGAFIIAAVPAGANYKVTASKAPYKPATKTGVTVTASKTTTVNLTLKF
jgi:hypothetical protein